MKKFNRQSSSTEPKTPTTEENFKDRQADIEKVWYENQIKTLEKELEDFKLEKAKLIDDQKYKVEGKSNSQLEEHRTARDGLIQVHQARLDKVGTFSSLPFS